MRSLRVLALLLLTSVCTLEAGELPTDAPCGELPDAAVPEAAIQPAPDGGDPVEEQLEVGLLDPDEKPGAILKTALKDAVAVVTAPIHWNGRQWLLAGASIATVAALGELGDVHLRRAVLKNHSGVLDDLTEAVEPFGQEYGWAVVGAYGVIGFAFDNREARDIAFDAGMSGLLASGITTGIKAVAGRARPNADEGAASFDPFGGDASFPSGHATHAFAVGSVIAAHSDQLWVKVSAYSLASLVAFSRVYHDEHWSSDVAAGALIGTVVGETVVRVNRELRASGGMVSAYAAPILGQGKKGAMLVVVF